ncbi:MAG: hypothetical protein K0S26_234 [Bacteroidota bacterium]|jgi:hypothetical protein|nr:hypothetical protein [Bacteroidota bacterium]
MHTSVGNFSVLVCLHFGQVISENREASEFWPVFMLTAALSTEPELTSTTSGWLLQAIKMNIPDNNKRRLFMIGFFLNI